MAVNRNDVSACIIECLHEVLAENNGATINERTDPMRGLGLDSEDGVNFACKLSNKLNYEIPDDVNPLVDDERQRPRRVGEIIDLVCKLLAAGKEENHG